MDTTVVFGERKLCRDAWCFYDHGDVKLTVTNKTALKQNTASSVGASYI